MPRIQLNLDVPQTDYDRLEEVARAEGVKVRSLLIWSMRADIAQRAAQAALLRKQAALEPTTA